MKKLSAFLVSAIFASISVAVAAQVQTKVQPEDLPHFFPPGIVQTSNPADQWEAYLRYLMATDHCQGVLGDNAKFVSGGNAVRQVLKIAGKDMTLILDPYVKNQDGRIIFTSYCGQEQVTEAQLKTVINYIHRQQSMAVDLNWAFYSDLETLAVRERAKKLGIKEAEFRARLNKPSRYKDISVREEHLLLPELEKSDFVPKEMHLGYFPQMSGSGVLGAAWLNSGTIYVTMQSLGLDYLVGRPLVIMHEDIHANEKLQSLPLSEGFNVELFASIPEMLLDEDRVALWFHQYLEPIREIVWVHFGFDFKQAKKEIIRADLAGNIFVDWEKFNKYASLLDNAKPMIREALKKALVEFYSDAPGWVALHDKLQNDYGVIDITFARYFDICVQVTDRTDCASTMRWLKANEEKIKEIAKKAFEESATGESSKEKNIDADRLRRFEPMVNIAKRAYPQIKEKDILRFLAKESLTLDDLSKMDGPSLIALFNKFLKNQEKGGKP